MQADGASAFAGGEGGSCPEGAERADRDRGRARSWKLGFESRGSSAQEMIALRMAALSLVLVAAAGDTPIVAPLLPRSMQPTGTN